MKLIKKVIRAVILSTLLSSVLIVSPIYAKEVTNVPVYNISDSDKTELLYIGMAEAGNQGTDGIGLVMQVIINRVESDEFPDSIYDVIHQERQFSPVLNNTYKNNEPNQDVYDAYDKFINGNYKDDASGAKYFCMKSASKWHDKSLDYLFSYGDHKFYK